MQPTATACVVTPNELDNKLQRQENHSMCSEPMVIVPRVIFARRPAVVFTKCFCFFS